MSDALCTCGHPEGEHAKVTRCTVRGDCGRGVCLCTCFVPASASQCECGHPQEAHSAGYAWCGEQCPCMLFRPKSAQ